MRKLHLIATLSMALGAAPYSSAQQQVLPSHFSSWTCSPGAEDVQFDRIPNFSDLTKEAGLAENEFCDYFSGTAKIHVDLQKYRDPSSAYEMYTALIRDISANPHESWPCRKNNRRIHFRRVLPPSLSQRSSGSYRIARLRRRDYTSNC